MSMPPLSALKAFEVTARCLSFSAAGREMNVTHAAIAQQVRALEKALNVQLVQRQGRGLALTDEGERLAADLRAGFARIRQGVERIIQEEADKPVRITLSPSFASDWLMPRLSGFREAHPDIDLMIHPSTKVVDLKTESFDLAIRYGNGDWPGMQVDKLIATQLVVAGTPALARQVCHGDLAVLGTLPWLEESGTSDRALWLRQQGLVKGAVSRVTYLPGQMMLAALREGQGIAATTMLFIEDDLKRKTLEVIWSGDNRETGYFLVTATQTPRPAVKAFMRWLKARVRDAEREADPKAGTAL